MEIDTPTTEEAQREAKDFKKARFETKKARRAKKTATAHRKKSMLAIGKAVVEGKWLAVLYLLRGSSDLRSSSTSAQADIFQILGPADQEMAMLQEASKDMDSDMLEVADVDEGGGRKEQKAARVKVQGGPGQRKKNRAVRTSEHGAVTRSKKISEELRLLKEEAAAPVEKVVANVMDQEAFAGARNLETETEAERKKEESIQRRCKLKMKSKVGPLF